MMYVCIVCIAQNVCIAYTVCMPCTYICAVYVQCMCSKLCVYIHIIYIHMYVHTADLDLACVLRVQQSILNWTLKLNYLNLSIECYGNIEMKVNRNLLPSVLGYFVRYSQARTAIRSSTCPLS